MSVLVYTGITFIYHGMNYIKKRQRAGSKKGSAVKSAPASDLFGDDDDDDDDAFGGDDDPLAGGSPAPKKEKKPAAASNDLFGDGKKK